jgi:serine/threonine protein kinase
MSSSSLSRKRQTPDGDVTDKYNVGAALGEGTYGHVFSATDPRTGKRLAIKRLKESSEGISPTAIREMALLRELHHENVVKLDDILLDFQERMIYLIFEFVEYDMDALRLHFAKRRSAEKHMPQGVVKSLLWQLLKGVAYLHDKGILHRDLKPSSMFARTRNSSESLYCGL